MTKCKTGIAGVAQESEVLRSSVTCARVSARSVCAWPFGRICLFGFWAAGSMPTRNRLRIPITFLR